MNKKGKLFKYLLITAFVFGISLFINGINAYAAGEHEFSLKFYDCGTLDEDRLTDTVDTERNRIKT